MKALLLSLLILLVPASALAGKGNQFIDGAPVALKPDMAYLLVRTSPPKDSFPVDIVFARALSAEELNAAVERLKNDPKVEMEPNVVSLWHRDPYAQADGKFTYVMVVKPGTYVLAGLAFNAPHGWMYDDTHDGAAGVTMCMGTVRFEAKAGVLTDLGLVLAARSDKPIDVPELKGYEYTAEDLVPFVMTVKPASSEMAVPEALKPFARLDADYRAMGPFPNYFRGRIDRLAPVAGVLDYDKNGHVIDLKAPHP
jgi:hypothetical protein